MKLIAILLFTLSAFAGEPYALRLTSSDETAVSTRLKHGLAVPIKVDGKKRILTALHAVSFDSNDSTDILVDYPQGWIRCKIVKQDKELDLCLLEPTIDPPFTVQLAKEDVKTGDKVINPNFFDKRKMVMQTGVVNGTVDYAYSKLTTGVIKGYSYGSSGGPILNEDGKIVGIGIAGTSVDGGITIDVAIFVNVKLINTFLKSK
jgi:S1-C subfamily serine protease